MGEQQNGKYLGYVVILIFPFLIKMFVVVLKVLSQRVWEPVGNNQTNETSHTSIEFKLMSYNVLAQDLLEGHPYLYKDHNAESLKWKTRWNNLFQELCNILPDVSSIISF